MKVTICAPVGRDAGKGDDGDADQDRHRRHLRRRGEEGRHRRRRAFVDVGRPHVERHRRDLEREAGQDEDEAEDDAEAAVAVQRRGGAGERHRAGVAVDQRRAVEQHARRQRAEDEIFEPRLRGAQIVAAIGGDDVERQAHQLEAEIERDEVAGRDQHHHAERGEQDQHRELEAADLLVAHEVDRQQQRDQRADQRQRLHEAAERIVDEGAEEGRRRLALVGDDHRQRRGQQRHGDLGDQPLRPCAAQRAVEDQRQHAGGDDRLGQHDRERESRHVHVASFPSCASAFRVPRSWSTPTPDRRP